MNSRRFLSEAARAAALVRVFALLVAMVSFCEAAAPRASAVVAVAIAVDELLQENTPALPDTLDDEDPQPAEPEPTARVCPCGCGKEHCGCSKSKSDEPIKEATDTRKVVRMWSPLWCGCCRTEERWIRDEGGKPDGDAEVRVEVIHEEKEGVVAYPHFEGPNGNTLTGLHHWPEIKALAIPRPITKPAVTPQPPSTVSMARPSHVSPHARLVQSGGAWWWVW